MHVPHIPPLPRHSARTAPLVRLSHPLVVEPLAIDAPGSSHRTGSLTHIGEAEISQRLGFTPAHHTVEGKSDQEWRFRIDGHDCAIWDAKGSGRHGTWSTFGPREIFEALFGWRAVV